MLGGTSIAYITLKFLRFQLRAFIHQPFLRKMVFGGAIRATGCASCQLSLLRAFTSVAGISIRINQTPLSVRLPPCTLPSQTARYSSRVPQDSQKGHISEDHEAEVSLEEHRGGSDNNENPPDVPVSAIPWYLQAKTPHKEPRALSERQQLPDLPKSPPDILQPLLEHVSVELGLDDLSLLDLRKLDPPPALGANLLMIIGTARSEKHLHVSADRFCRWLRSTYKLRPDADGLLGRNELKLKLKRKSKRAKLLGSGAFDDISDDGVRTGWVCVDVGVVEGLKTETYPTLDSLSFVGFGRKTDGVKIVVQMLTEEMREEIDLEGLWSGILRRATQPQIENVGEIESAKEPGADSHSTPSLISPTQMRSNRMSILPQSRTFHTSVRKHSTETTVPPPNETTFRGLPFVNKGEQFDFEEIEQSVLLAIESGNYERAKTKLIERSSIVPQLQHGRWRSVLLQQLRIHLEKNPREQVLSALGSGFRDYSSTPFLSCFYQSISAFPSVSQWEARIWLHCYARELNHEGYTLSGVLELLDEVQLCGIQISRELNLRLLRSLLQPVKTSPKGSRRPPFSGVHGSLKILRGMYDQGLDVLTEDVFMALQDPLKSQDMQSQALLATGKESDETFGLLNVPIHPLRRRVHLLMTMVDIPSFREESLIRLLDLYASQNYWIGFWEIFRLPPRQGKPRSASLYTCMFQRVADTHNQKACISVLRSWLSEMEREDPVVRLEGDIVDAIKACLKVAEPCVVEEAANPGFTGEWANIWRQL